VQPPGLSYKAHWEALGRALCLLTTPAISGTGTVRGRGFCPGSRRTRARFPSVVWAWDFLYAGFFPGSPGLCSPQFFALRSATVCQYTDVSFFLPAEAPEAIHPEVTKMLRAAWMPTTHDASTGALRLPCILQVATGQSAGRSGVDCTSEGVFNRNGQLCTWHRWLSPQAAGVFRCPKLICDKSIIHQIMGPPSYD